MQGRKQLTGERVKLASIREDDIDTIISWDDDPEYMRNINSGPAYPGPQIAQREWWTERLKKDDYHLAIRLKEDDRIIGTLGIAEIEWHHRVAWIAIGIGAPDARGKGYGTEAMTLGIDFAFNDLNLYRLSLSVFAYNQPAIRLYQRLGFTHEGNFRQYLQRDGQRHDMLLFGLLADEWAGREQGTGNREQGKRGNRLSVIGYRGSVSGQDRPGPALPTNYNLRTTNFLMIHGQPASEGRAAR